MQRNYDSTEEKRRYGFRKMSVGLASALLSSTLVVSQSGQAHAATTGTESANANAETDAASENTVETDSGIVVSNSSDSESEQTDQEQAQDETEEATEETAAEEQDQAASEDATSEESANSQEAPSEDQSKETESQNNNSSADSASQSESASPVKEEEKSDDSTASSLSSSLVSTSMSTKDKMAAAVSLLMNDAPAPAAASTNLSSDYYKSQELTDTVDRTVNYKTTDGSQAPESKKDTLTYKGETITGDLSSLTNRATNDGLTVNKGDAKTYSTKEEAFADLQKQVDEISKALSDYERAKASYDSAKAIYDKDMEKWNAAQSSSDEHTVKGISQSLTFINEKNADISISSPDGKQLNYIKSSAWLGDGRSVYGYDNISKSFSDDQITTDVNEATMADTSKSDSWASQSDAWGKTWTGVRMKVGESVLATYTNLENSVYIDKNNVAHKIGKATIKYTLNETTANDGTANIFLNSSPTITVWFSAAGDNKDGKVDLSLDVAFYDTNGNKIDIGKGDNAWFSMSSLNHLDGIEYFNPGTNDTRYIPGSTITQHDNGMWYSDINNEENGKEWDSPTSPTRYYGASIMEFDGTSFHIGKMITGFPAVYDWFALDTNLATAYKPIEPTAPTTKPTITYHDVTATVWEGNKDFTDVNTPELTGYQPDKNVVSNKNIPHDAPDITETVTYTPNAQKAKVTYIDQTTGETLKADELNGVSNGKSGYTTGQTIQGYQDNGYELVSDDTNGQEIVYDNDGNKDQEYKVVLKHTYTTVTEEKPAEPGTAINKNPDGVKYPDGTDKASLGEDVNRTITYKTTDGSKAPEAVKDTLHYTLEKTIDKVTGQVVDSKWSANQDFKDVTSPTITGYTVDKTVVSNKDIAHDAQDISETVTYTPDPQKAKVTYVDQTTGKTLKVDDLNGVTNGKSGYTTGKTIEDYKNNGYLLVSDTSDGKEIVFDNDGSKDQNYVVTLKHDYTTVTEEDPGKPGDPINKNPDGVKWPDGTNQADLGRDVRRTVTYQMSDGSQAPGPVDSILHFTAKKIIDKVTGEVISTSWSPAQDYDDINSPDVKGYTPDKKVVSDKGITYDHSDINEVVNYNPNPQKATVTFVDELTGKTITVKALSGKSNGKSGYTTAKELEELKAKGYELASDDTNGQEVVFDDDDNADQNYTVKLTHRIDESEDKRTVTRTIKLHEPDGVKTITQKATITREVKTDAVTGEKTYGEWSKDKWDEFDSPEIKGYTASLDKVLKEIVDGNTKDKIVDIYYKKKEAPAPAKPETPAPAQEAAPAPAVSLPQTGNENSVLTQASGMFAVGGSLLAAVVSRKKKRNE